jgi:soluble lytic murein transglycosylase-like protein
MSLESVMSRVSQLQAMLAGTTPSAPAQAPGTDAGSFSSALASATTAASLGGTAGTTDPATLASMASPIGGLPAATTAAGTGAALPASVPYAAQITAAARANGLDPALLAGLIKQESGFNPNAGSGAGARGLTQLMPATAAALGVTNVLDPQQSIEGGAKYLKRQLDAFGGDVTKALAAYNAGPGAVQRFGGVPPYAETQNYVRAVQANAAAFRSSTT